MPKGIYKRNPEMMTGKYTRSEEHKEKVRKQMKGNIFSYETRRKISNSIAGKNSGENQWNWKGGISPFLNKLRMSYKYRQWRSDVFTKDNFTCQDCDKKGGNLVVHHIKELSIILEEYNIKTIEQALNCEELWNINNGLTLCKDCHTRTDSYGVNKRYKK